MLKKPKTEDEKYFALMANGLPLGDNMEDISEGDEENASETVDL